MILSFLLEKQEVNILSVDYQEARDGNPPSCSLRSGVTITCLVFRLYVLLSFLLEKQDGAILCLNSQEANGW